MIINIYFPVDSLEWNGRMKGTHIKPTGVRVWCTAIHCCSNSNWGVFLTLHFIIIIISLMVFLMVARKNENAIMQVNYDFTNVYIKRCWLCHFFNLPLFRNFSGTHLSDYPLPLAVLSFGSFKQSAATCCKLHSDHDWKK